MKTFAGDCPLHFPFAVMMAISPEKGGLFYPHSANHAHATKTKTVKVKEESVHSAEKLKKKKKKKIVGKQYSD